MSYFCTSGKAAVQWQSKDVGKHWSISSNDCQFEAPLSGMILTLNQQPKPFTLRASLTITEISLSNNPLPGLFWEQSCILFPSTKPKCYPHLYCPPNNYWETKAPSKPLPTLKIWVTKDFKKVISLTQWYWAMKIYDIYGLYGWGEHEALAQTSWKLLN